MKPTSKLILFVFIAFFSQLSAQAKIDIVIQNGHYEEITDLCFSPDGKYLASGGKDGKAIVWDLQTGKQFRRLAVSSAFLESISFSPDGNQLICSGRAFNQGFLIYDWRTGDTLSYLNESNSRTRQSTFENLAISPDKKDLLYFGKGIQLYDLKAKKERFSIGQDRLYFGHTKRGGSLNHLGFSPDGKTIAFSFGGRDMKHMAFVMDAKTGALVSNFKLLPYKGKNNILKYSSDSKYLWVGDYQEKMLKFEIGNLVPVDSILIPKVCRHGEPVFSADMRFLYTVAGSMQKIDLQTATEVYHYRPKGIFLSRVIALSPDGNWLATCGQDSENNNVIWIINAKTQTVLRSLRGYRGAITSLDFSPKGRKIACGSRGQHSRLWDLGSAAGFTNLNENVISKGSRHTAVRIANDGETVLLGLYKHIHEFGIPSGRFLKDLDGLSSSPNAIGFSHDGEYFATYHDKMVRVFNAQTWSEVGAVPTPASLLRSVQFSPDGQYFLTGGHKEINVYKCSNWKPLPQIETDGSVHKMVFSPDGSRLAWQENSRIRVMNWAQKTLVEGFDEDGSNPAFSPDGKYLVSSNNFGIQIRDAHSLKLIGELSGHGDYIQSLTFPAKGRNLLASGGDDTSIKLWDLDGQKLLATLIGLDQEDFIIVCPDNYYLSSKNGVEGVVFRKGDQLFPFEQFDLYFNRPDIVLERLGFASQTMIDAYKRSHEKRLKKSGFRQEDLKLDFHLPEIRIKNRQQLGYNTDKSSIDLVIEASDSKYTLDRFHLWINDVPVLGSQGMSLKSGQKQVFQHEISVELLSGDNKIQVSVLNANGVESLKSTLRMHHDGPYEKPELYLVSIGASEYQESRYNLTYAAKDARDISAMFQASPAFQAVHHRTLVNEAVTRDNILDLSSFLKQARTQDVVLIFVAGHGLLDESYDYYFATWDMDFNHPALKGMEYSDLESLLDGIKALRKILIMDTCHSGEVEKDEVEAEKKRNTVQGAVVFRNVGLGIRQKEGVGAAQTSELMKALFTDLRRGTGATVISSAGGAEYAMESDEWKNGLFTWCLLHSLKNKSSDLDRDGNIHLSELQKYVIQNVKKLSEGKQIPTSRIENQALDYHVW